jgi:tetratricopeptide (TPR) repeat protein
VDYDRLRELQEKFDENPRRYFAPLANEYRKGGQPKRAIEICRAHLAQMPGHMSGQIVFGQALFEAGEWDEARAVFERALTLDPENLIALRSLGDMSLQAGQTSDARTWYSRLLDADPKDAAVTALIAEIDQTGGPAGSPPEEAAADVGTSSRDQELTYLENAPASEAPTPLDVSSSGEPASSATEEPLGLERHYPVEPLEEPALESAVAETGDAIESITSAREDVPGALDGTPGAAAAAEAAPEIEVPAPAEERSFSGASPEPFVNETMAQLYLQQGYRQLALKVYRQLSASRPNDQTLRDRIAEIEAADAADHPSDAPVMRREEPSIERPSEPAQPRTPSIESPTPWSQPGSEESPGFDRSPIDSPPTAPPSRDRESIESPAREEPRAEPEGIAAREPSIREFFATLGRRRPPRAAGSQGSRSGNARPSDSGPSLGNPPSGASLDTVFAGASVSPSDARAASRLAGAFSANTTGPASSRTPPTPAMPTPRVNPRVQQPQESEEDVAKFRAWLDGLTRE